MKLIEALLVKRNMLQQCNLGRLEKLYTRAIRLLVMLAGNLGESAIQFGYNAVCWRVVAYMLAEKEIKIFIHKHVVVVEVSTLGIYANKSLFFFFIEIYFLYN